MTKTVKIILGIILIFVGWLSLGIGYTIKSDYNGLMFYSGFILFIAGIIVLINKKNNKPLDKKKLL